MIIQGMTASLASASLGAAPIVTNRVPADAAGAVLNGVCALPHLGVILVQGTDAATFLQGQLTQDVLTMALGESRLAAFCSAKGRMQASFQVLKRAAPDDSAGDTATGSEFLLVGSRDILAATCKRLSMFLMRAKAKLTDASDQLALFGLLGQAVSAAPGTTFALPPSRGVARALCVLPAGGTPPPGPTVDTGLWLWAEVQSGIGRITLPTVEAFVPQMLNYESVGGVNFKKGCYPGQEVVARSQFRGTLKRRAYLVQGTAPMAPGDAVFGPADAEQSCGTVVLAARAGGAWDAIVSMQVAAALAGGLTVGSPSGAALEVMALPYALLDDV
jgi:tRNA-modifying protein YgfZ